MASRCDQHGRYLAASVPGWGYSWWLFEQGITRDDFAWTLGPSERLELFSRFAEAIDQGWWPDVDPDDWVGSHHPFDPDGGSDPGTSPS